MLEELTKREKEVVEVIIQRKCFTVGDIAKNLTISPRTAMTHLRNIYNKKLLDTNSIACLIWSYYNEGGM